MNGRPFKETGEAWAWVLIAGLLAGVAAQATCGSGALVAFRDNETGCEYIGGPLGIGMQPRLNRNGEHVCRAEKGAE